MEILCYKHEVSKIASDIDSITASSQLFPTDFDIIKGLTAANGGGKYATLEERQWLLDGKHKLPIGEEDDRGQTRIGYWSGEVSNAIGSFSSAPTLTITFINNHTNDDVDGITMIFSDEDNYASSITVTVFDNDLQLKQYNISADSYIVSQSFSDIIEYVQDSDTTAGNAIPLEFNKIIIKFNKSNQSMRFIKLLDIKFGDALRLPQSDFYDLSILEDISIPSDTLPINTLTFTLNATKNEVERLYDYSYMDVYNGGEQLGKFYLSGVSRMVVDKYVISAEDVIGLLERAGTYTSAFITAPDAPVYASAIIADILSVVNVKYNLHDALYSSEMSIKFDGITRREALAQTLLMNNCTCLKQRNGILEIVRLDTDTIIKDITDDIFAGYQIEEATPIQSISLATASFIKGSQLDTSNLSWAIVNRTTTYIQIRIEGFSEYVTTEDIDIAVYFSIQFDDENIPYNNNHVRWDTGLHNHVRGTTGATYENNTLSKNKPNMTGKCMPEKIQYDGRSILLTVDQDALTSTIYRTTATAKGYFGDYPYMSWDGKGGGRVNTITGLNKYVYPYLDFTKSVIKSLNFSIMAYGMDIETSSDVVSVGNPYLTKNEAKRSEDLTITTVQSTLPSINGVENDMLSYLMNNYYRYNYLFKGKIQAEGLNCGDTIQMTLEDMGTVKGTISRLEYQATNKSIADAIIQLYYERE